MSRTSPDRELDLESQQTVLLSANKPRRDHWRKVVLIVQACKFLIANVDNAKNRSLAPAVASSSTPYTVLNIGATGHGDSHLPTSPQVSLDIHPDEDGDHTCSNRKRQLENIAKIVKEKSLSSLRNFGDVQGIAEALDTNLEKGITGNEEDLCSWRIATAHSKTQAPAQGFFRFLLKSCNSCIIFLLLVSAVLSLAFGIKEEGARTGWYEGVIIILAVIILVTFSSMRDYWHESSQKFSGKQQFSEKREMEVDIFRGGCPKEISISNVVLGDIVCLKRGYQVPADGLFISGESLQLDDFSEYIDDQNPFLFYGSKVTNGNGRMLVTCVGMNTKWGELMSRVTPPPNKTPLQVQLDKVSTCTQIMGLTISLFILVALFLRFELEKDHHKAGLPELKGKIASKEFMEAIKRIVMKPSGKISILTTSLTVWLVGIVEGFPFIVTLAITYWNKKALFDKAIAHDISTLVTMGLVTTICTDKTGGLTLDPMEVDMCWIGEEVITEDSEIASAVLEDFCDGISTPVLIPQSPHSSKDEPLLSWAASKLGLKKLEILKQSCIIVEAKEMKPDDERSGALMRKNGDSETNMRLHWKGPATKILAMCSHYYDSRGKIEDMDENKKMVFEKNIELMHSKDLKSIAFAYRKTDEQIFEEKNLILIGLLGLKHTCWKKMRKAMVDCRNGVSIKLVSQDDVSVLKAIAEECSILMPNSDKMVLEAEEFRNWTNEQITDKVDRIAVMGNASPSDKLRLVQCLKQKGHIVAVVGVRTTETAAMKEADVGIAMGTWSTKLARESSDIISWDDNFIFLVTIVRYGRCAYDNIRKYIQLELTGTIAGLLIISITTISLGDAPITTIHLVWANLIVIILGGLALLTEPPSEKLMDKPRVSRTEPLITKVMWRNIVAQTLYQTAIIVSFLYKCHVFLGINRKVGKSMIFNSFVFCQVFNQFNMRELEKKNLFKGILGNHWFWVAVGLTVVLQAAFIEVSSIVAGTARLNCEQWAICFLIGMISWVIHWSGKWTSDFIKDRFIGLTRRTPSAPSDFALNLELPLINGESTSIPS